jgi:hypothetical protein
MAILPLPKKGFYARYVKMAENRIERLAGYGAVEAALVQAYCIPSDALGAFRGRLGALQKQGLLGARNMPGKGIALRYGPDQFHRLLFACELLEFGISPAVVLSLVNSLWERRLLKIFKDAEDAVPRNPGPDDVILYMGGVHLMRDALSDAIPNVNSCRLRKLPDHMTAWMSMGSDDPWGLPPRALVTNLTMRLRAFHTALADSFMDELRSGATQPAKIEASTTARARRKK